MMKPEVLHCYTCTSMKFARINTKIISSSNYLIRALVITLTRFPVRLLHMADYNIHFQNIEGHEWMKIGKVTE